MHITSRFLFFLSRYQACKSPFAISRRSGAAKRRYVVPLSLVSFFFFLFLSFDRNMTGDRFEIFGISMLAASRPFRERHGATFLTSLCYTRPRLFGLPLQTQRDFPFSAGLSVFLSLSFFLSSAARSSSALCRNAH